MILSWSTILLIILAELSSSMTADDPCRFKDDSKGVIDLTSVGRTDGNPAYPDVLPSTESGYKYSYNPCKPFSEGSVCRDVASCQISLDEQFIFSIGAQNTAEWISEASSEGTASISYIYGGKQTIVSLQCSTNGTNQFEALGENPINVYRFRLTHRCACWNACGTAPPQQNCSVNGSAYTSDKQIIQSFPFHVLINPHAPQPLPLTSSYVLVDMNGHVIELTLVNIESVPSALFCLSKVQVLSFLDSTDLSISSDILHFASSLLSFTVSNISTSLILPPELFKMTLLTTLSIVDCGLETLSEDIIKLEQLTQLNLDHNQLVTLPATLSKLPSLTLLSVNNNPRLSSLDALDGSKSLITLRASNCMINHLPTNISNLRTIEMNDNELTSLDGIETVTSIICDLFSFANNQITSISSTSLQNIQTLLHLDLSDNLFTTLPDSIYRIKHLQTLDIRNNDFDEKEKEWIQGLFRLTNTTIII